MDCRRRLNTQLAKNVKKSHASLPKLGQIRQLPQKGVFGVYLERYSFPPRKTRVRSIRVVHGWTVVKKSTLNVPQMSRTRMFRLCKSANCPPKQFLEVILSSKASRPQLNRIIRSIWSIGGGWCSGLKKIRCKCRELDHCMPKIWSESEKYGICGVFHVLGLETRILSYQSSVWVHGWRFERLFEGNSSTTAKMIMLQVQN